MSHPAISSSVEAANGIGGYQFQTLTDIQTFTAAAPEAIAAHAQAFAAVANQLSDTPAASVADAFSQVAAMLQSAAEAAGQAGTTLRAANQQDFDRIENPRPAESMADFSTNAAG